MKALGDIVRENIKGLQAYSCARAEFEGTDVTLLDANENPFASEYNRYPDPFQRELKREIGRLKGVEVSRLVLGNGSDELIDMLIRTVCTPRRDNIIVFSPGYSMYEVSGRVNDVEVRCLELDEEFQPGWNMLLDSVDQFTKMIFFCTPNNPVGNVIPLERIREVASRFDGIVVVDEAYIDFGGVSALPLIEKYDNLLIVQTFSKSRSMAGMRIGYAMGNAKLIRYINDVKYSFNSYTMNRTALALGVEAIRDRAYFEETRKKIIETREWTKKELRALGFTFGDSMSNFIFASHERVPATELFEALRREHIYVRHFTKERINNYLRISIGTREEMETFIRFLKEYLKEA